MIRSRSDRDRGVSISVTHVLTIGITTILIAMLLTSASTMLETESDHSAEESLETIGERLADEIRNVDQIGDANTTVNATVKHPRRAASSRYTVELESSCDAPLIAPSTNTDCLKLTAHSASAVVYVPIETDADLKGEATGGTIEIQYNSNGDISITEGSQ
ncbi:hypothetical protein HYG81_15420 [Natrinema zhouii]|uniref:Uncharacterized protein n=1 Tax=Natrinema zhouii TaxID=1710539 RepID=A0A7D6CMY4_9EURY|nr:hypothetical protein [Natrinema zhouii]QLK25458.1 hypothetical protein HYG81_15420 [Natrinema zhouii]